MSPIANTSLSVPAKKRILAVCVKLFIEQGYKKTTMAEIIDKAEVSASSFQNIFRAKDGVLTELVEFMFENQFTAARRQADQNMSPVLVYAVETAIQLTLTELNENLREIYLEAYSNKESLAFIQCQTAREVHRIFGFYHPELSEQDYYQLELGVAGIMRGYMAHPCDEGFPLEKKLRCFMEMSLRAYKVPEEEIVNAIRFVETVQICAVAQGVMDELFHALAMHYDFTLSDICAK